MRSCFTSQGIPSWNRMKIRGKEMSESQTNGMAGMKRKQAASSFLPF